MKVRCVDIAPLGGQRGHMRRRLAALAHRAHGPDERCHGREQAQHRAREEGHLDYNNQVKNILFILKKILTK